MAGQEVPSPPSACAAFSHFPSLSDNMEKFVSLIKRGDCTVSFVVLWCSFLPLIAPQVESACSQVGVARSTFYRWQSVLNFSTKLQSNSIAGCTAPAIQTHPKNSKYFLLQARRSTHTVQVTFLSLLTHSSLQLTRRKKPEE
jgi:hypothetical protein